MEKGRAQKCDASNAIFGENVGLKQHKSGVCAWCLCLVFANTVCGTKNCLSRGTNSKFDVKILVLGDVKSQ